MKTDELIGRYLLAAAEHWEAQRHLGERSALRHGNRAADELRRIAVEIGSYGSTGVHALSRLLDDPRNGVDQWAAVHVLEVMTTPSDVIDRAFDALERIALGDDANAIGTRMRLKELRAQFGRPATD